MNLNLVGSLENGEIRFALEDGVHLQAHVAFRLLHAQQLPSPRRDQAGGEIEVRDLGSHDHLLNGARLQQITGGLIHADVGLDAAEDDLVTAGRFKRLIELRVAPAAEVDLLDGLMRRYEQVL